MGKNDLTECARIDDLMLWKGQETPENSLQILKRTFSTVSLGLNKMKKKEQNIIYAVLVIALVLSPLLMPSNGKEYTAVASCVFVALCFVFKVQSAIKTFIPVFFFSVVMPIAILVAIARPTSTSWLGAASYFYDQFNASILLGFISPVLLALILHFGLVRLSLFRRDKTV